MITSDFRSTRAAPLILMGCLMVLFLSVSTAQAVVTTWTGATDNDWNTDTNWDTGAQPTTADDVLIPVTLNSPAISAAGEECGSLEVKLGAVLHINNNESLTVDDVDGRSGNVNNAGFINIGATSAPGGQGTGALYIDGDLLNTGVVNMGANDVTSTLTVGGTLNNVGPDGAPVQNTGSMFFFSTGAGVANVNVSGDWISGGTFDTSIAGPGDANVAVDLQGSGIIQHTSINGLVDLSISGGTRTLAADLVLTDELLIPVSAVLDTASYDINVGGDTTVDGKMTASGGTQTFMGDVTVAGLYTNHDSAVTVNIDGLLTVNGTAILGSGPVYVESLTNAGQLTSTSGNLSVEQNFDNGTGLFNHNGGTLVFTDTGDFTPGATTEYNNITKTGLGTTTTLAADLIMVGAFTVDSGTFSAVTSDITVGGNVDVSGVLNMGTGTLILNPLAGATQTFDPGVIPPSVYADVTKQGDGVTQLIDHELGAGDLLVDAGTFAMGDLDVMVGDLTVSDTATLTGNTGTLTVGGLTNLYGTFNTTGAATHRFIAGPGGVVHVHPDGFYNNGTNPVTVYLRDALSNDGNVTLGSGDVEINGQLTNNNILTSTSSNLMLVSISGPAHFDNSNPAAVYNHNGGTLVMAGTATLTPGTSVYNNITKTGANTTTTLADNVYLNALGLLSVESGTFLAGANDTIEVGGVVIGPDGLLDMADASNVLRVAGDFINNADLVGFDQNGASLFLTGTGTFTPGPTGADYDGNLFTQGVVSLAAGEVFEFAGSTWTNTGTWTSGVGSIVKFVGTMNQTLTTGGAPGVPAMNFANIETDNDDTVTFATQINLTESLTVAGNATLRDVTPGSVYNFADTATVYVSGTWTLTGSQDAHIQLLGPGLGVEGAPRWTLQLNSSGTVNINYVDLRDSELITHGGSLNGKNVGYTVVSLGNLSPSWGPFDPVPVPQPGNPSDPVDVQLTVQGTTMAAVGETVSLQLVIDSTKTLNGVSAYLSYDPSVLAVGDAGPEDGIQPFVAGDFIGGLPFENTVANGILKYTEGNVMGAATGTGTVATVSFEVISDPTSHSTLISFVNDAQLGLVTSVSSGGSTLVPEMEGFTLEIGNSVIPGDANRDGVVNLSDFSILAAVFGTTDPSADFDGDGIVSLNDFSILAANFGQTTATYFAAPTVASASLVALHVPEKLHKGDVIEVAVTAQDASLKAYSFELGYDSSLLALEGQVSEGDFLSDTLFVAKGNRVFSASRSDVASGSGVLAKLQFRVVADGASANAISLRDVQLVDGTDLFSTIPEIATALRTVPRDSRLLANYPNPFNPETWMPFELADDADVRLDIFDTSGRLIRTLDLGYRPAGHYVERSAAAYWDGLNSSGEHVASGVYVYRLSAGEFSALRRMVIMK